MNEFTEFNRDRPCPICCKPDWCCLAASGMILCRRSAEPPSGYVLVAAKDGGGLFRRTDDRPDASPRHATVRRQDGPKFHELINRLRSLTPEELAELAAQLGVTPASLTDLDVRWADQPLLRSLRAGGAGWQENYPNGAYGFPERDGRGRVVGLSLRTRDGRKGGPSRSIGARRGLIVSAGRFDGLVLIVEGASDVAALRSLGLSGVGRPSNSTGADDLATLLEGRDALVIGEQDDKPGGAWPGRDGAKAVAESLATSWDKPVRWSLPPHGVKDIRSWLSARFPNGVAAASESEVLAARKELLGLLESRFATASPGKRHSVAEKLVRLAGEEYRFGRSDDGRRFAVPRDGPNIALPLDGDFRSELVSRFRERFGTVAGKAAVEEAMNHLACDCHEAEPELLHLRVARHGAEIVVDLGTPDGRVVVIGVHKWRIEERSPILFARTKLTAAMPEPTRGGDLNELRTVLNVQDDDWPCLVGFLAAAFFPEIPHPLLMLVGGAGTGKSTAGRLLTTLVDPGPAPLRAMPQKPVDWWVAASASWMIMLDNVSRISDDFSDTLCRAITGDADVRRKLYTDSDVTVHCVRRVVAMTTIDAGALRSDLGDRLLVVDLAPIPDERRRTEADVMADFERVHASVLGAVFDLVAAVLARLPTVRPERLARMADFTKVLAAVDHVLGSDALTRFMDQRDHIAQEVVESSEFASELVALIRRVGRWRGTAAELASHLKPNSAPLSWPTTGKAAAGQLRRLVAPLRRMGIHVHVPPKNDKTRVFRLELIEVPQRHAPGAPPSDAAAQQGQDRPFDQDPTSVDNPAPPAPGEAQRLATTGHSGHSGDGSNNSPNDGLLEAFRC